MSAPALTPEMIARSGESKFSTILAILLVGGTLSTTVVVLRLITRFYIIRTAGLDDYFIGVAQVCLYHHWYQTSSDVSIDFGYWGWCCDWNG